MTKQNRIHRSLVVRERCRKEALKFLASIPHVEMKRKRTYMKAFFKRYKNYEGWVYDNECDD